MRKTWRNRSFHIYRVKITFFRLFSFKGFDVLYGFRLCVVGHIQKTKSQLSQRLIAFHEVFRFVDFLDFFIRKHFARLVMFCKGFQKFWLIAVVFQELGRKLHEIPFHRSSRKVRILGISQNPMQCVSKFMEQCRYLLESQQTWRVCGRFREITHYGNMRSRVCAVFFPLIFEAGHPCACSFAFSREIIYIKHCF